MPQTRLQQQQEQDSSSSSNDGGGPTAMNITMSQETLASFITTIQQTQSDFCQQLLREVRSSTPQPQNISSFTLGAGGNFAKCSTKYGGRAEESVENFIAIITYKECVNMSDENALRGLSMLLEGPAAVWWQGIKRSTRTWAEALVRIRSAFGEHDPPHRIYRKLFILSQEEERTDLFIAKVRALFAKLPTEDLSEKVQLDMAFGLLSPRIRKRVNRDDIQSFDRLLEKCRSIEDSLSEEPRVAYELQRQSSQQGARESSPQRHVSPGTSTAGTSAVAPTELAAKLSAVSKSPKKFCVYCKRAGHLIAECEKLKRNSGDKLSENNNNNNSDQGPKSEIKCYGCGAPNIIKAKCKNCSPNQQTFSAFYSVNNALHEGTSQTTSTSREPRQEGADSGGGGSAGAQCARAHKPRGRWPVRPGGGAHVATQPSVVNPSVHASGQGNPASAAGVFGDHYFVDSKFCVRNINMCTSVSSSKDCNSNCNSCKFLDNFHLFQLIPIN